MKLKNLFFKWAYNDTTRDFFIVNRDKINQINSSFLNTLNNIAVIMFGLFSIYSKFILNYNSLFPLFIIYFLLFIIVNLLSKHAQHFGCTITSIFLYPVIAFFYILGIYIGCFNLPDLTSVMYPVFVICIPLIFVIPTIRITAFTLIFTIIYIFFSKTLKPIQISIIDITNIIACSLISSVTAYSVTCARIKEISANIKLEHACNTDELTGLHNRRSFNIFIEKIFDNPIYNDITLMMIDIDNFKDYNDLYGHIYGDNCLMTVGKVFKEFETNHDCYISRYGGEEFVLVDYKHNLVEVELIAKNLIQLIYDMNIENINSHHKKLTISIGISSRSTSEVKNYIDLINLADDALYQAKNNGKNTLMIARHSMTNIINTKKSIEG